MNPAKSLLTVATVTSYDAWRHSNGVLVVLMKEMFSVQVVTDVKSFGVRRESMFARSYHWY